MLQNVLTGLDRVGGAANAGALLTASYLCECVDAQFTNKVTFCRVRRIRLMTITYCCLWLQLRVSLKTVITGQILLFTCWLVSCIFSTCFIRKFITDTNRRVQSLCRSRVVVTYLNVLQGSAMISSHAFNSIPSNSFLCVNWCPTPKILSLKI